MRQATEITNAPIEVGGAGCTPAYAIASSGYITHLLKNWNNITEATGPSMRILVSRFQQASGISKPVLEFPSIPLNYVSGPICQAIRKYLRDIDATIKIHPTSIPPPLRQDDIAIMDKVFQIDHAFNEIQLQQINSCRLFLGVTYLSEICNVNGTNLIPGIEDGDTSNLQCTPTLDKIYQPSPGIRSWAL